MKKIVIAIIIIAAIVVVSGFWEDYTKGMTDAEKDELADHLAYNVGAMIVGGTTYDVPEYTMPEITYSDDREALYGVSGDADIGELYQGGGDEYCLKLMRSYKDELGYSFNDACVRCFSNVKYRHSYDILKGGLNFVHMTGKTTNDRTIELVFLLPEEADVGFSADIKLYEDYTETVKISSENVGKFSFFDAYVDGKWVDHYKGEWILGSIIKLCGNETFNNISQSNAQQLFAVSFDSEFAKF